MEMNVQGVLRSDLVPNIEIGGTKGLESKINTQLRITSQVPYLTLIPSPLSGEPPLQSPMATASSLHLSTTIPLSSASNRLLLSNISSLGFPDRTKCRSIRNNPSFVHRFMCSSKEPQAETGLTQKASESLQIGSPIIIVEAPKMLKTAASVPCLRVNSGLVKAGDVGRIMSRKPKDVWAVRLAIGTYLIDGVYFKPLQLDEDN